MDIRRWWWKKRFRSLLNKHITIEEGLLKDLLVRAEIDEWTSGRDAPWRFYSPQEAIRIFLTGDLTSSTIRSNKIPIYGIFMEFLKNSILGMEFLNKKTP